MILAFMAVLISAGLLIGKSHPWMMLGGAGCIFLTLSLLS